MAVYDDEKEKTDSKPASDEQLRHITGIDKKQEAEHDRKAHQGAAQDKKNKGKEAEGSSKQAAGTNDTRDSSNDTVGRGYNAANKLPGPVGFASRVGGFFFGSKTRRNSTIAGSVIAVIIGGFGIYSFFSLDGFEFIQIDHLMQQLHFETQQDESNDRITKLMRYVKYTKQGRSERTNMGYIGNKMADKVEKLLNEEGLKSTYSPTFGLKEGYIIDRSSTLFKDKSFDDITKFVHDNMGANIKVVQDANGVIRIVQPSGYRASLNINKFVLQQRGMNKVSAAVLARIMGVRDGVTWHPLRKLDAKTLTQAEKLIQWTKDKISNYRNGTTDAQIAAEDKAAEKSGKPAQQNAKDATGTAKEVINEGDNANQDISSGSSSKVGKLSIKIGSLALGGGASAAAVLCIARGIASQAGSIKENQLGQPLARMGVRSISEGEQVEYGKSDIDPQQLQLDAKSFYDPSNHSTWFDAESIQWGLGKHDTGIPPNSTLQNLGKGTPFDFLLTGAFNAVLTPVCSAGGQAALTIVSFLGGPVSALASLVAGAALGPPIFGALAHWLAGDAANVLAQGADWGSNNDFGSHLAANDTAITSAMPALTKPQEQQLARINQDQMQRQFDQHSFAYKLLSPTDSRTYLASVMDHISPSITADISNTMFGIINIKNSVINIFSSVFSHTPVHAAADLTYDYGGTPTYDYSVADMDSSLVENPYQNGDTVADILSGPSGGKYIDLAQKCFGDSLTQIPGPNGTQIWDVQFGTSAVNTFDKSYKDIQPTCSNHTDLNWLRICFFIFDTQNIKALDCYLGGSSTSSQSCSEMGMLNAT